MEKTDIKSLNLEELTAIMSSRLGEKPFRAKQIYEWLHRKHGGILLTEMTNISAALIEKAAGRTVRLTSLKKADCADLKD